MFAAKTSQQDNKNDRRIKLEQNKKGCYEHLSQKQIHIAQQIYLKHLIFFRLICREAFKLIYHFAALNVLSYFKAR